MKIIAMCALATSMFAIPAIYRHAAEEQAATPAAAITDGQLLLNLRGRYEHVEQDDKPDEANALTLRTLLGWQTGNYRGFSALLQLIDVGRANDNYNDTKNGRTQFPVVADPDNTDINQLYLDYTGLADTRFRLGKQLIKLDNVRFVGNVEFRQVMPVFTGATVENRSLPDITLYGGHLERLKTATGDQQAIRFEILHSAWEWAPANELIGYGYFLDSAKTSSATGFADNSNRILGMRANGDYALNHALNLLYTAVYARQKPYADGDSRIDADYVHGGFGLRRAALFARIDYEIQGSNGGVYGFQTPLGTNHPFQGWADQFLTTPPQGMRDAYLTVGGDLGKAKWTAEYHDFRSDTGSIHYGNEVDAGVSYPLLRNLSGKIEIARFREGDVLPGARKRDTDKFWLTLIYTFE